jgi:hypothetical protein
MSLVVRTFRLSIVILAFGGKYTPLLVEDHNGQEEYGYASKICPMVS